MKRNITAKDAFKYIIKCVRPFHAAIFVMFSVAIFWAVDLSLRPFILKIILNKVAEGSAENIFSYLSVSAISYALMSFLAPVFFRLHGYFVEIQMTPRLRERISNEALNDLLDQSHSYYQRSYSGSLANKINDLMSHVPTIIQIVIDQFFSNFLALIIAAYVLWQVNDLFAIIMLSWVMLFMLGSLFFARHLSELSANWSEYTAIITGKIVDILSNILSVRLFSSKNLEKELLAQTSERAVIAEQKFYWFYFWIWVVYGSLFSVIQALNLYYLIKGRQEGWISIGDFALVLTINIAIVEFIWVLTRKLSEFSRSLGIIIQALQAITEEPEIKDIPEVKQLKVFAGKVSFEDVTFHYKSAIPLFKNMSVVIEAGQKVGLVGYSGSGKSTFVNVIIRLYDINQGKICIDDQDISKVTQDSLRDFIGMIQQDPSLFHRTLMDNIRYGKKDATEQEVIEAAKRAYADEFIAKIPEGYQTIVGERGVKLSGGQRQRIAIARAILKNAPILILDEATSQLDSVTESYIQDSLTDLMEGKTTLVVAHRLSTLLHMDRILVFDQGEIVEDGTHQELLAKAGLYKTLWDAQVGGFLPQKKVE